MQQFVLLWCIQEIEIWRQLGEGKGLEEAYKREERGEQLKSWFQSEQFCSGGRVGGHGSAYPY